MTGRWVLIFRYGIAFISKVFLIAVSNVRIPLSQRITFSFPLAKIYSEAKSSSSSVEPKPLFNKTGLDEVPTASNNLKFCIFLVPICNTSTYFSIISKCLVSIISLNNGSPFASDASRSILSPSSPNP